MTLKLFRVVVMTALLVGNVGGETTFLANNTAKTLASNEGDGAPLHGASTGAETTLTLSQDDGGGDIKLTSVTVSSGQSLFMDSVSMGHQNEKWGANQNWTFKFDKKISFDALNFTVINENMMLKSTAWASSANTSGSNWTFSSDGTEGVFTILGASGPGERDFTSAGVSDVPAGTEIGFGFFASASGGEKLISFTITPVVAAAKGTLIRIE